MNYTNSVKELNDTHLAQILTYTRLTGVSPGFLFNFNTKLLKDGVRKVVLWLSSPPLCPLCPAVPGRLGGYSSFYYFCRSSLAQATGRAVQELPATWWLIPYNTITYPYQSHLGAVNRKGWRSLRRFASPNKGLRSKTRAGKMWRSEEEVIITRRDGNKFMLISMNENKK
jgi:hypothetical protein